MQTSGAEAILFVLNFDAIKQPPDIERAIHRNPFLTKMCITDKTEEMQTLVGHYKMSRFREE